MCKIVYNRYDCEDIMDDTISDTIDSNKFIELLSLYVSLDIRDDVIVQMKLDTKYRNGMLEPNVIFFFDRYVCGYKITVYLNKNDILSVLNGYAYSMGSVLINYHYVSGVRKVKTYMIQNIPYFDGVMVEMKKIKKKVRK